MRTGWSTRPQPFTTALAHPPRGLPGALGHPARLGPKATQTRGLETGTYAGSRAATQEQLDAVVRDGEPTVEAVIVRRSPGGYRAYDGTWLGVHGEGDDDEVTDRLLGGTIRLTARLTAAAQAELRPLPGWVDRPWLKYRLALVLEDDGTALLGADRVSYDDVLGLVVERG
ncbi:hypothetical protein [Streptomyces viridosporus]|uniref:hypothetical protein n=1 Tax=Streptomyces viridosporus TaxID=67581 RepID=UPI00331E0D34